MFFLQDEGMNEDPIFFKIMTELTKILKKCPFVDKWLNQTLQHLLMHMNIYKKKKV